MKDLILSLSPGPWKEYELIDTGGFEKLERFGKFILSRPEPQAIWDKSLPDAEWKKLAHAHFAKEKKQSRKRAMAAVEAHAGSLATPLQQC